jgi:tyrosine-protein phosphatase SIW14
VLLRIAFTGTLVLLIIAFIVVPPLVQYRWLHTDTRRLREVTPGRVYRSGQMTADGFAEAVRRFGIRTVVNLQDEYPDPDVPRNFLDRNTLPETEVCRQLGLRYVWIPPDLVPRQKSDVQRPAAVDRFLEIMDDPDAYPVLVHCRAGLHRTGCMIAVYRMEYEGWTPRRAFEEMKANGFGDWACTASNDYVAQYVLSYQPRAARDAESGGEDAE